LKNKPFVKERWGLFDAQTEWGIREEEKMNFAILDLGKAWGEERKGEVCNCTSVADMMEWGRAGTPQSGA
jgi:hypothetical protein